MKRNIITYLISIILLFINLNDERIVKDLGIQLLFEINLADYDIFLPQSIDIDSSGNIVFFDRSLSQIVHLTEDNPTLSIFGGGKGRGPNEFLQIWGLKIDEAGNIYLSDMDKQKLLKWNIDQSFIGELNIGGRFLRPMRITLCLGDEIIYVLSSQYGPDGYIHKFDTKGKHLASFQKIEGHEKRLAFYTEGNMACNEQGELFYATRYTNIIRKYDQKGNVVFERNVFGFPGNEKITQKEDGFTSLADGVKRTAGEAYLIENSLVIAFSGRNDEQLTILDVYSPADGSYRYSFKLPNYFTSYAITNNRIVTFEKNNSDDYILRVYKYDGIID